MKVIYKKLNDLAKTPTRGSQYSAGYDLYAAVPNKVTIQPHETVKIGTGLAFDLDLEDNLFAAIFARSGLSTKKGLRPANCVGVCDVDYRGEYKVPLHNDSDKTVTIDPGERIAQLVFLPFIPVSFLESAGELSETARGDGGFGNSGRF